MLPSFSPEQLQNVVTALGAPAGWILFIVVASYYGVGLIRTIYDLRRADKDSHIKRIEAASQHIAELAARDLPDEDKRLIRKALLDVAGVGADGRKSAGANPDAGDLVEKTRLNVRILLLSVSVGVICEAIFLAYFWLAGWSMRFGAGWSYFTRPDGHAVTLQLYVVSFVALILFPFGVARLFFANRPWWVQLLSIAAVGGVFCAIMIVQSL